MSTPVVKALDTNVLSLEHAQQGGHFNAQASAVASTVLAGLYTEQTGGYQLWSTPDWNSLVSKFNDLGPQGFTLVSIDTHQEDQNTTYYTGCWTQITGGHYLWRTTDWDDFMSKFNQNASSMRLLDFDIHSSNGNRFYTGTWGSSPISQRIIADLDWDTFTFSWRSLSASGWRLTKVQVYQTAGPWHLAGLFEQGSGDYAFYMLKSWNDFLQKCQDLQSTQQLVDFQVFDDADTRWFLGVWRQTASRHQFVFGLDWSSFVNQWSTLSSQGLRLQKAIRYSNAVSVPQPQWDAIFRQALGTTVQGYAYYIVHNGQVVANGVNHSRSSKDAPEKSWSIDTRINLASVSKSVAAVAVMKLLNDHNISVNSAFYPYVKSQFPTVGTNVDKITIAHLLQMKSGMVPDATLYTTNYWDFLKTYLAQQNVAADAPGKVYAYSNTNFTILQAFVDILTGHAGQLPSNYPTYVNENVLKPMGINLAVFNTQPDPRNTSALYYNGAADTQHGTYFEKIDCVAAGGWVSSARELIKFLTGVRNSTVLSVSVTYAMLEGQLGWYKYDGVFGEYYHHNGGLWNGDPLAQGLKTGIIHLSNGYDALILINDWNPDPIGLMIKAFETR